MAYHIARNAPANPAFFNRFPANDLATFFKLLNDTDDSNDNSVAQQQSRSNGNNATNSVFNTASFATRFDIREAKDAYHVTGEVAGVDQKDISIEFTDHNTLVVSGHTSHESETTNKENSEAAENQSEKPKKTATVEDENDAEAKESGAVVPTKQAVQKANTAPQHHYIMRERSFGHFRRSFTFPGKVDQDAVKANLKNGVLSIVVPKATFAKKTISIE